MKLDAKGVETAVVKLAAKMGDDKLGAIKKIIATVKGEPVEDTAETKEEDGSETL